MVSSLEGRRTVTGGVEDSDWRGGGQLLEGRWAEDSHWRGGGQPLEGRRTATGGAEDSDWNDRCPSGPPYPPPPLPCIIGKS